MAKEKMARTDDAVGVARAAYEAYVAKDRAAIERLIADDFHFTSPLDNGIDRATYFDRCWPNSDSGAVPGLASILGRHDHDGSPSRLAAREVQPISRRSL